MGLPALELLPRGAYWAAYLVNGCAALFIIDSAGNWYGHILQFPGERGEDTERRAKDMLDLIDPVPGTQRPDLRVVR